MENAQTLSRWEALLWVGKIALGFFTILAILFLLTLLTPRIAAWVDKKRGKTPPVTTYDEHTQVRGLFDADAPAAPDTQTNEQPADDAGQNFKNDKE